MGDDEPFGHLPDDAGDEAQDPLLPPSLADGSVGDEADGDDGDVDEPRHRIPHRYRSSLGASALAAGMIGLRDILEEPKDDRPVVEQFRGEDDTDRPIEVELDPDDPSASVVRLRDVGDG